MPGPPGTSLTWVPSAPPTPTPWSAARNLHSPPASSATVSCRRSSRRWTSREDAADSSGPLAPPTSVLGPGRTGTGTRTRTHSISRLWRPRGPTDAARRLTTALTPRARLKADPSPSGLGSAALAPTAPRCRTSKGPSVLGFPGPGPPAASGRRRDTGTRRPGRGCRTGHRASGRADEVGKGRDRARTTDRPTGPDRHSQTAGSGGAGAEGRQVPPPPPHPGGPRSPRPLRQRAVPAGGGGRRGAYLRARGRTGRSLPSRRHVSPAQGATEDARGAGGGGSRGRPAGERLGARSGQRRRGGGRGCLGAGRGGIQAPPLPARREVACAGAVRRARGGGRGGGALWGGRRGAAGPSQRWRPLAFRPGSPVPAFDPLSSRRLH